MRTVTLPGTDLTPSALCLGTNRFGTVIARDDAFALLDAFVGMGGTFIDTANIYADWIPGAPKSASENTIGAWLRSRGNRAGLTLATKGGHPDLRAMSVSRLSPAELRHDAEASLANLGVERIDLYWLHRDDPAIPVGEILEAVEELAAAGLIRYYGASNWRPARMRAAHEYAQRHGLAGFSANQPQWSLAVPNEAALSDPERLVVFGPDDYAFHRETGMAVMPWSAQGQGFFEKLARGGVDGLGAADRRGYLNDLNVARFARVAEVAQQRGVSLTVVALAYLMSQPFVTVPVIGPRSVEQLAACAEALDCALTPAEIAFLAGGLPAAGVQNPSLQLN